MKKLQILFPDPLMLRMREIAESEDLPVSEIVRRATSAWLEKFPQKTPTKKREVPVVDLGECTFDPTNLREYLYE